MDVRKPVPQWDSFTFTKIDDDLAVAIGGVQQGPGSVNYVYCLQMKESATTNDPEWVCHIIESVDSICRDSADTQYILIQTNFSKSPKQLTYTPL